MSIALERAAQPQIEAASAALGISAESLRRLRMGWMANASADTFPMRDESTGKVIGIRIRVRESGKKWSITGGHEGLFIPTGFNPRRPFMVCEGPTDTGTALDLGFAAIGKPSCRVGNDRVLRLVQKWRPPFVIVCGDNDEPKADGSRPGLDGANQLMLMFVERYPWLKAVCIIPPDGIKDLRQWRQAGATRDDVAAKIREYQVSADSRRVAHAHDDQSRG